MKELEYLTHMQAYVGDGAVAADAFSELLETWPSWTDVDVAKFTAATLTIKNTYDLLKVLSPPEKYTSVHQTFLKAAKLGKDAMPLVGKGIDDMDAMLIVKYRDLIRQSTKLYLEAAAELEKLKQPPTPSAVGPATGFLD